MPMLDPELRSALARALGRAGDALTRVPETPLTPGWRRAYGEPAMDAIAEVAEILEQHPPQPPSPAVLVLGPDQTNPLPGIPTTVTRLACPHPGACVATPTWLPILPRADRVRFEEIAQDLRDYYETTGKRRWKEVRARFDHLAAFFAGYRAAAIGAADITRYVKQRQGQREQPANGTLNRELAVLSKMMRLAYENGKLVRLPVIRKLKEAAPRAGFFEREAYEAVQRHLPEDLRAASAIAYTYGWRILDEVLPLERRQVDLEAGTLRLDPGRTKNEDGRVVYLTPELRVVLSAQVERVRIVERQLGRIIPYLFPHLRGRRRRGERRQDFRKAWTTACKKAGVPGMLRHDFRRTAVRNMVNAGVPERVAMKVTGHKTRSVFDRYHIVSPADLQDVARRLAGTISGTVQTPVVAARPASSDNLRTRP